MQNLIFLAMAAMACYAASRHAARVLASRRRSWVR